MAESRYNIIVRFLRNELTAQEVIEFNNWRKVAPENEQQFQEVKFLWEKAHLTSSSIDLSVNKKVALAKVHRKINKSKVVPMRRNFVRWAAAAAVLLLLGGGVGYNLFFVQAEMIHFATTANEKKEVILPDNSKVWMDENSKLSYATKFVNETREVQMEGNVTFEVTPDKSKPFIVQSDGLSVTVLGTKFNVHSQKGENKSVVHVMHGKVRVASKIDEGKSVILTKGMTAQFNRNMNVLAVINDFSPNHLFWVSRTLIFKNQKLGEVIAGIEIAYEVNLELTNKEMLNCPFTGNFEDQNIDEVLDILQTLYDFEITKQDSSTFKITRGLCN